MGWPHQSTGNPRSPGCLHPGIRTVRHCTRLTWHDHSVIEHGESVPQLTYQLSYRLFAPSFRTMGNQVMFWTNIYHHYLVRMPAPSLGLDPVQVFSSFPGLTTRVNFSIRIRRQTQLFVMRTYLLKSGRSSKHRRCSRCQKMFCLPSQTAMSFIFTNAGTAKAGMWVELCNASRTE